ncbi:MAG: condensation domain-containing protein [Candidatus Eisenbacteria bacterium]
MKNLEERLAALSPEQRALLESRLKQKGLNEDTLTAARAQGIRPIPNRESLPHFPISLDQERLWFIDQMEPGNPAYNIHTSTRMVGPMDAGRMERAINLSVARHEGLRATFQVVDDRPVAVITPKLEVALEPIDLTQVPPEEKDEAARVASVEYHRRRFDLARGPLVRAALLKLAPEDHVLLICMHHAVTDRWSFDVFEAEVGATYVALGQGRTVELPHLPIQYADFAAWQRAELSGERLERHLAYWKEKLRGAPLVLEVPTDRPRPAVQTFTGGREYIIYSEELLHALKGLTQKAGATMFMTALAALDILCWKYSGQRDLLIGSAIADRNRTETENVIGYFLNMLLLRGTIDPAMSFRQFLAQVKETAHGAVAHQEVPFATLVDLLEVKQDPSRNPLMQVSYIYLDFPITATPEYSGFTASSIDVDNGASRFDLTLACTEVPGLGLHTYFEYNGDLYDPPKVARMLRHLGRIFEFAVAHPDLRLAALELVSDDERAELAVEGQEHPYAWDLLHARCAEAARSHAPSIALTLDGRSLTYQELAAARDRVAAALAARGIGAGKLVAIAAERSVAQVAAILGVLEAGAAYVPLDLSLPEPRLVSMLRDVAALDPGPRVVLAESRLHPPAAAGEPGARGLAGRQAADPPAGGAAARRPRLRDVHLRFDRRAQGVMVSIARSPIESPGRTRATWITASDTPSTAPPSASTSRPSS